MFIEGGDYYLDKPLVFDHRDNGNNGFYVVYSAHGDGRTPRLRGDQTLHWRPHDVDNGIWSADLPGNVSTRSLFINGKRAHRSSVQVSKIFDMKNLVRTLSGYWVPQHQVCAMSVIIVGLETEASVHASSDAVCCMLSKNFFWWLFLDEADVHSILSTHLHCWNVLPWLASSADIPCDI